MANVGVVTGSGAKATAQQMQIPALGKDEFFKMLIAQLKNQDPTNPLQGTEFAAQLAQFASLEQLSKLNTAMASQNLGYDSLINLQAANLVGKEVIAKDAGGSAEDRVTGPVSAVNFKDRSIYLTVNDQEVAFSDVLSVK